MKKKQLKFHNLQQIHQNCIFFAKIKSANTTHFGHLKIRSITYVMMQTAKEQEASSMQVKLNGKTERMILM